MYKGTKQDLCKALLSAFQMTRYLHDLQDLEYVTEEGCVIATFKNGYKKKIDVRCDSGIATIFDLLREL